jgi:hypothetical protein
MPLQTTCPETVAYTVTAVLGAYVLTREKLVLGPVRTLAQPVVFPARVANEDASELGAKAGLKDIANVSNRRRGTRR